MYTFFEELLNAHKLPEKSATEELQKMGQELNRDIVEEQKTLNASQSDYRRELNGQRIKALGLKLIQGGKV